MKKTVSLLLCVILALSFTLSGCGGSGGGSDEKTPSSSEGGGTDESSTEKNETTVSDNDVLYPDTADAAFVSPLYDTCAGELLFTAPDGVARTDRLIYKDGTGGLIHKEISLNSSTGWKITIIYKPNDSLDNYDLVPYGYEDLGKWDGGGEEFTMSRENNVIGGLAQHGSDVYNVIYVFNTEEDIEILKEFLGTFSFKEGAVSAENDLTLVNMEFTLPEYEFGEMYSEVRVRDNNTIDFKCISYELHYPDFLQMYFYPGDTVQSRRIDDVEEKELNGIPVYYKSKDGTDYFYFERPEGLYYLKLQMPEPDEGTAAFCNEFLGSVSFK